MAVAADLMQQRGVARTTVEDIQEAAGISSSQLYHYFADKGAWWQRSSSFRGNEFSASSTSAWTG